MKGVISGFLKHKHLIIFTIIYFVLALFLYKDFGATYDEKTEYDAGKYLIKYYQKPTNQLYVRNLVEFNPRRIDNWQLPLFSHYSRVYPMILNFLNPNYFLEWFHIQNIFFGYFLFFFSYLLFYLTYASSKKAILGPVTLFLTPVISGHIPANPKDIPFAISMLVGSLCIYFFRSYIADFSKNSDFMSLLEILVLGVVFGVAQSLRTVGLTLFVTYIFYGWFLADTLSDRFLHLLKAFLLGIISLLVWILLVPYIGANVIANLVDVLTSAYAFSKWDNFVLYLGNFLTKEQRPWHYLFVYLTLQLPLTVLFGLFGGFAYIIRKKISYNKKHPVVLIVLILSLNIFLYLLTSPVVYNGVRHFLYLVMFLCLLATFFILDMVSKVSQKIFFLTIFIIYSGLTFIRMVELHPYEYVYYNELIGGLSGAEGNLELDYWGASYKESTNYVAKIAEQNDLEDLRVYACDIHFAVDYYANHRFKRVSASKDSDVVICDTFKVRVREATDQKPYTATHPIVKSVDREGVPLSFIYIKPEFKEYFVEGTQ